MGENLSEKPDNSPKLDCSGEKQPKIPRKKRAPRTMESGCPCGISAEAGVLSGSNKGGENQMLITTHSPYILGAINNLLYADKISPVVDQTKLGEIIPRRRWIPFSSVSAYFIKQGKVESCLDEEFQSIKNEVIDGAAQDINDDYDQMIRLKEACSKGE